MSFQHSLCQQHRHVECSLIKQDEIPDSPLLEEERETNKGQLVEPNSPSPQKKLNYIKKCTSLRKPRDDAKFYLTFAIFIWDNASDYVH